jgi:microcystin-dependent protein
MDPFIGQIVMFGGNFAPSGWALCDGQLLPISTNTALFSILGTTYGGDGETTFGLPDLRGRFAMHPGRGAGLTPRTLGQKAGTESHVINVNQLPSHVHSSAIPASSAEGETGQPGGANLAAGEFPALPYGPGNDTTLQPFNTGAVGASQSVPHVSPFQCVTFIIALQGVFPSQT